MTNDPVNHPEHYCASINRARNNVMPRCRVEHLGLVASPGPVPRFDPRLFLDPPPGGVRLSPPPVQLACVALSAADLDARLNLYAGRAGRAGRMEPLFGGRKTTGELTPPAQSIKVLPTTAREIDPDPPDYTPTEDAIICRGHAAGIKYPGIARKLARLGWPSRSTDSVRYRAVVILRLARRHRSPGRRCP